MATAASKNARKATSRHPALAAIERAGKTKVKVAVTDIDGVLRGKYLNRDKFLSAADSGFGFCDVVFGWDMTDACYDNTHAHRLAARLSRRARASRLRHPSQRALGCRHRLLPRRFRHRRRFSPTRSAHARRLKRVLRRAAKLGLQPLCGLEFEWFNFRETPISWAEKKGVNPTPLTPGMFGYSLLRANENREFFNALLDELGAFGVPIEGLHTETGPGVYEAALLFSEALEAADRGVLFKTGAKEIARRFGIMPSFMAKWNAQYPGCSGHVHQSLSDGKRNVFFDHDGKNPGRHGMSKLFESYLAGQVAVAMEFAPMFWPTINSYKRLVDGFWAPVKPTWGVDNRTASFRVIPGSPKSTRLETRCPGADINPYLAVAALVAAGLHGVEKNLKLTTPPITGTNQGAENIPRAPRSLAATTEIFKRSAVARDFLGDDFVEHFAATREWEYRQWQDGVTDWELKRYFEIV